MATAEELAEVKAGRADPRGGALNGPNEDQALRTLRAAVQDVLQAVCRAPLLAADGAASGAGGGSSGGAGAPAATAAAAASAGEAQAERQLGELHLQQLAAQTPPQQDAAAGLHDQQQEQQQHPGEQQQQQEQPANENGFDADWHMSRHFCRVYLRGQRTILERSLAECERLLGQLGEVAA